jgi:hypothetical protein
VTVRAEEDAEKIALIRTLAPKRFELPAILAQMAQA